MRKKTIVILTSIAWGLFAISLIFLFSYFTTFISMQSHCSPRCSLPPSNIGTIIGSFLGAYVLLLASMVLHLISLIAVLIKQAKQQQWAWFVCTIVLGAPCTLVYLIVVPEMTQSLRQQARSQTRRPIQAQQPSKKATPKTKEIPAQETREQASPAIHLSKKDYRNRGSGPQRKTATSQKAVLAKIEQKRAHTKNSSGQ